MKLLVPFLFFILPFFCFAYPDFIGNGYRTCMTCHDSGAGGGSLTDYGRAYFAAEVAANPFGKNMSEDDLAANSNFLFKTELPSWLRLGFKYRSVQVRSSPGSAQQTNKFYNMQNDLNINFYFDENHSYSFISTLGYVEKVSTLSPQKTINSKSHLFWREYFAKVQLGEEFWLNVGLMDKVFGLRTPDHTAVNRADLGLGQFDQVHGAQFQWADKEFDLFLQGWLGNLSADKENQTKGGSLMLDHTCGKENACGLSLLAETSNYLVRNALSTHGKLNLEEGNSILAELGYQNVSRKLSDASVTKTNSFYLYNQNLMRMMRGLYFLSGFELNKETSGSNNPLNSKWGLGFLYFPIQRAEFRLQAIQRRFLETQTQKDDQWSLQAQTHLSF